ncbi:MAG: trimethylamine methyltransferase family protein [Actinobacteria bacterium]|nr:trimethylamine methyltransferase family protein [Actinomycetota bacterium]
MSKLFEIKNSLEKEKLQEIHDFSCRILETTGMKFISDEILDALEKNGSKIDRNSNIAYIPRKLVEKKLNEFSKEIAKGKKHVMLNGGVSYDVGDKIFCKFGSTAPRFFDLDKQKAREATENDLINSIKFGQAVDEIGMVGCPMYTKKIGSKEIDPNFTPIINAMLLAKFTTKLGNSEVNSLKQLKYLIEMGIVIRGSKEKFLKDPCFLTAKESISPLLLEKNACDVLVGLAKNGLPATMIPMPIMGASMPVTISGAVAVTNAEIIATMTALRCIVPDAMVGGGSMASFMDMSGKGIKFNVIDAIKVDMVLSQLYEELYSMDFGCGIYSSDSKLLGSEILIERFMKILGAFFVKKYNYVIGLYDQGMVFSPELALVEIEIIKALHEMSKGIDTQNLDESLISTLRNLGPGGNFLSETHTLNNFKKALRSKILEEVFVFNASKNMKNVYERANAVYKDIMKNQNHYRLSEDKEKEIDDIVRRAHKDIISREF